MNLLITALFLIFSFLSFVFIFLGGFGTFLILLFSFIYALLTGFKIITPEVLLSLGLIYLTGELFDYIFIILGAKISGAGKKAAFGAIIGGLIGAAISLSTFGAGFFILTLIGIFSGAFLVELSEKKNLLRAFRAAIGALLGRFSAVIFKAILGFLMLLIIVFHVWSVIK